jgi:uncharacterized protein YecE (DUF72 family)
MLQFGYLNKIMLPGGLSQFIDLLGNFIDTIHRDIAFCVEIRNPNFLTTSYFKFLRNLGIGHVFLQGYYMPPIYQLGEDQLEQLTTTTVVRLLGSDREDIERRTGKQWNRIVSPRDPEIEKIVELLINLKKRDRSIFVFVNNHFEGSAPRTIEKLRDALPGAVPAFSHSLILPEEAPFS